MPCSRRPCAAWCMSGTHPFWNRKMRPKSRVHKPGIWPARNPHSTIRRSSTVGNHPRRSAQSGLHRGELRGCARAKSRDVRAPPRATRYARDGARDRHRWVDTLESTLWWYAPLRLTSVSCPLTVDAWRRVTATPAPSRRPFPAGGPSMLRRRCCAQAVTRPGQGGAAQVDGTPRPVRTPKWIGR